MLLFVQKTNLKQLQYSLQKSQIQIKTIFYYLIQFSVLGWIQRFDGPTKIIILCAYNYNFYYVVAAETHSFRPMSTTRL